MEQKNSQRPRREQTQSSEQPAGKQQWQEPKLNFCQAQTDQAWRGERGHRRFLRRVQSGRRRRRLAGAK